MIGPDLKDRIFNITKLRAATTRLAEYGADPAIALKGTGLVSEDLRQSDRLISIHQLIVAYSNIARARISPTLPFEIGRAVHVSAYGIYGYALLCSKNFRHSVKFAERYHMLALPISHIRFTLEPKVEGWVMRPIDHPLMDADLYAFVTNFQLGVHTTVHCDIMGPHFRPDAIQVDYGRDQYYQLPPDCTPVLRHGAVETKLFIGAHWLDAPPELGNEVTFVQFERLCRSELADIGRRCGLAGRIRTEILKTMAAPLSLEQLAHRLGVTGRTLRRQLAAEETSYRELLNEIRKELAMRYVEDGEMTNADIAHALGFSDSAGFRKAFRRWTGGAAGDFRPGAKARGD